MPAQPASARLWVVADAAPAPTGRELSMPATARRPRRLTDAQLQEMLDLASHADSVELKLTVPDAEGRSTVNALGMDPLDAQIRQVFFLDTPTCASTTTAWSSGPAGSRAAATTRWSSCA
jgi:hypothetical protein